MLNFFFRIMLFQPKMVDTATGASPPWTSTRDMASSPINFEASIHMMSDEFHRNSTTIDHQKRNNKEIIVMNEYVK